MIVIKGMIANLVKKLNGMVIVRKVIQKEHIVKIIMDSNLEKTTTLSCGIFQMLVRSIGSI